MKRYAMLIFGLALMAVCGARAQESGPQTTNTMDAEVIALVAPQESGATLLDAMMKRASVREFADRGLTLEQLSGILWAAAGKNRPDGKQTTPSALALYPIMVYAVLPNGIYLYSTQEHTLTLVCRGDHRAAAGMQEFVYTAPLNLMYVTNLARFDERPNYATETERLFVSALDAGHYSQSAALWAAGSGMGSVPRGWTNAEVFLKTIDAPASYRVVLAQTFGLLK